MALLYTKAFCVRINGVGYSTIFEQRISGTREYKGISLYPVDARTFAQKQRTIAQYTDSTTTTLLVDENVSLNLSVRGKYIFVAATDGRVDEMNLDPRWINYMKTHSFPDLILIDREEYPDYSLFFVGDTGNYILKQKSISAVTRSDYYYIVSLTTN